MGFFEVPVITERPLAPLSPPQRKILQVMGVMQAKDQSAVLLGYHPRLRILYFFCGRDHAKRSAIIGKSAASIEGWTVAILAA